MLAEDAASDEAIAAEIGINRATLALWKHHNDFQARIAHHLEVQRTAIEAKGIADRRNRVARLNADWLAMQQLRDARKTAGKASVQARQMIEQLKGDSVIVPPLEPGIETGLLARQEKPTQFGTVIELAFDRALLAEMRDHEKQAAMELGQWTERQQVESEITIREYVGIRTEDV